MGDFLFAAAIVGTILCVVGVLLGAGYLGGQQRLQCIEAVKHLPAADIAVVCRK